MEDVGNGGSPGVQGWGRREKEVEIRENGLRRHAGFLEAIFSLALLMASFSSITSFSLNVTSSEKPSLTILSKTFPASIILYH